MNIIREIEIYRFRSIEEQKIKAIGSINVFWGKNDVGKSNFLKALNLFFNGETDWAMNYDYESDFNIQIRKERKSHEPRRIRMKFKFAAPVGWNLTSGTFSVYRKWDTLGQMTQVFYDNRGIKIINPGSCSAIAKYLKRTKYLYIPAVRGRSFLEYLYSLLQNSLFLKQEKKIEPAIETLNREIISASKKVQTDFNEATDIKVDISIPERLSNLYKSFQALTKLTVDEKVISDLSIDKRGDGIQARFMATLLNFVAEQDRKNKYIWGFEEPENSLEYNLAKRLAERISTSYYNNAQVFITSHSPAFIASGFGNTSLFSVEKNKKGLTSIEECGPEHKSYLERIRDISELCADYYDQRSEIDRLVDENKANKRIIIVEGRDDKKVIEHIFKLYQKKVTRKLSICINM